MGNKSQTLTIFFFFFFHFSVEVTTKKNNLTDINVYFGLIMSKLILEFKI